MPSSRETRVYVGNLPGNCTEKEVEQMFQRYGKIVSLTVKNPRYNDNRASSFAFIEYEDPADADDVVRKKNGMRYDGTRIRVEFPHGNDRGRDRYSGGGGGGGGYNNYGRGGRGGGGGGGGGYSNRDKVQRSRYRLRVTGMPMSGSWQDLKDHMREVGEVCFADVDKKGSGVVEFFNSDDMKLALKKLENSKFRSHEGDSAYIHLSLDESDKSRSRSDSRSRSRSYDRHSSSTPRGHSRRSRRSPTYSPVPHGSKRSRSRSRSHSRSRSPAPARKRD